MKIEKKDVNKVFKINNFFDNFKFKYDDNYIFELSKDVEVSIDRLLKAFEEINKKKGSK
ncbi:MAG: hypothetical protein ACYCSW_06940 [bacterium]